MTKALLATLFARHYRDSDSALARFQSQLTAAGLDFSVEKNTRESAFSAQPGFPAHMPSSIYYFVSGSGFGSIKKVPTIATASSHLHSSDGVGLNMGCPIRLAHALDVLFSLKEEDTREALLQIKSRENHLATVEELLWLTIWHGQEGVTRGGELVKNANGGKSKDIDWFFVSDGMPVYLEAKFRKTDWIRLSDQEQGQLRPSFFNDIGSKFPKEPSVLGKCVAGITGFAEPDDDFFALCEKKLLVTSGLSAILFRTLLGPITVCSLDPATVVELAKRVRVPQPGEYPWGYPILFNRSLQKRRIEGKSRRKLPLKGLLYYSVVPKPMPSFKPKYPVRGKIPKWSTTGMPEFEQIPPFVPPASSSQE